MRVIGRHTALGDALGDRRDLAEADCRCSPSAASTRSGRRSRLRARPTTPASILSACATWPEPNTCSNAGWRASSRCSRRRCGSLVRRAPVVCTEAVPVDEVARTMREQGVGSVVVVDQRSRPVGIFTKRRPGRGCSHEDLQGTPVSTAMTRDPIALPAHALAYEAALAMIEHRIRHVLVTEDGKLVGVVSERDLFSLQRLGLGELTMEIRLAADIELLARMAARDPPAHRAAGRAGRRRRAADAVRFGAQRPPVPASHRDRAQAAPVGAHRLVLARLRQRGPARADLQHRPGQRPAVRIPRRRLGR